MSRSDQPDENPTRVPTDRFEAIIFTLADHAVASKEDGKLYIHGAGVGRVWLQTVPGPLPSLFIVLRLRIPWHKTTEPFRLRLRALNADRSPVDRDPLIEITPEVGRPSGLRPGDEIAINVVLTLTGMPVQSYGTIYFHLEVDGEEVAMQPLKIEQIREAQVRLLG